MNMFGRVLLGLFSPYLMFFIIDNQRGILTKNDNYHAVHEEPEHITNVCTNRSAWTVVYLESFLFPLIDRLVCTIQSNQTSDALIKYVAQYHILYSGLLEICLSVHCLTLK